jgi:hypothetical protein
MLLAGGMAAWVFADDPVGPTKSKVVISKPDRSYGTALQWQPNYEMAAKRAERERKLLLVLAVAGHFEDPFFT